MSRPGNSSSEGSPTPPAAADASTENLVTPAIQAKFDEVFGGSKTTSDGANRAPTSRGRQARAKAESRESLESSGEADPEELDEDPVEDDGESVSEEEAGDDDAAAEDGKDAQGKDEPSDGPTLPEVLRHAAKRNGWTDAEIDQFAKVDLELATRTFEKLHGSYSDMSAQFARLGASSSLEGEDRPARGNAKKTEKSDSQDPLADIFGAKLDSFAANYGETFVQDVLDPLVKAVKGPLEEAVSYIQAQQLDAVRREMEAYFGSIPKEYHDLYGTKTPNAQQATAREELADQADMIRAGARLRGIEMSVAEALDRAASIHASKHLQTLERKRITSQLRDRAAKITTRPSHRSSKPHSGERSEDAAREAYAARAAELGFSVA
ncbi:MAG: hypothetical protein IT443_11860 [Phycisphaeraceae bacterium]|nr:hypothetical protein [Phycisphaeraceae bacterium]